MAGHEKGHTGPFAERGLSARLCAYLTSPTRGLSALRREDLPVVSRSQRQDRVAVLSLVARDIQRQPCPSNQVANIERQRISFVRNKGKGSFCLLLHASCRSWLENNKREMPPLQQGKLVTDKSLLVTFQRFRKLMSFAVQIGRYQRAHTETVTLFHCDFNCS